MYTVDGPSDMRTLFSLEIRTHRLFGLFQRNLSDGEIAFMLTKNRFRSLLGILLSAGISSAAFAEGLEEPEKNDHRIFESLCESRLTETSDNAFRQYVVETLENDIKLWAEEGERLHTALDEHLMSQSKDWTRRGVPAVAPETMKALLKAYGDDNPNAELPSAIREAEARLKNDPYFLWLAKNKRSRQYDPIKLFLGSLNPAATLPKLKLSLALFNVRAKLQPYVKETTRKEIADLLALSELESIATLDLATLRNRGEDMWGLIHSLQEARKARNQIMRSIPSQISRSLSFRDFEILISFLRSTNPDIEILRRYCRSVDGDLKGNVTNDEMTFLTAEAERIRRDVGWSDHVTFNTAFVSAWSSIWGASFPHERILLRHFYVPREEGIRIDDQVQWLNLVIEVAEAAHSNALKEYYNRKRVMQPHN
jgi:hypothetical protein